MTEQEIQAFVDKTRTDMEILEGTETTDTPFENRRAFTRGIDAICEFITPLAPEVFQRWVQLIVHAYGNMEDEKERTKLQRINQVLAKRSEFDVAIHALAKFKQA